MPRAERLGDTGLSPTELPTGARKLPQIVFSLLIGGCYGDQSRRRHPLVWLYTDHLSWLIFIPGLGQSWYWERLRWGKDIQRPDPWHQFCVRGGRELCLDILCACVQVGGWGGLHCCVCVTMCSGDASERVEWCLERT